MPNQEYPEVHNPFATLNHIMQSALQHKSNRWKFFGGFGREIGLFPKRVFRNGNRIIVLWNDNTRTMADCGEGDHFDPMVGFSICLRKKMFNKKRIDKINDRFLKQLEE